MSDPVIETLPVRQPDGTTLYVRSEEARQLRAEAQARAYFGIIQTLGEFGAWCAERWPGPCLLLGGGMLALYQLVKPAHTGRKRRR